MSPHLDDAVLSAGATIFDAVRAGTRVTIVTIFAGEPSWTTPAGDWDARAGFRTAGEAAARRREEDAAACAILGAEPVWLSYADEQYTDPNEDPGILADLRRNADGAAAVLLPGAPLLQADHRRATRLALAAGLGARTGFYVEEPYAAARFIRRPGTPDEIRRATGDLVWAPVRASAHARAAKRAAVRSYASQLPLLGGRWLHWRISLHERWAGGETIAWSSAGPSTTEPS